MHKTRVSQHFYLSLFEFLMTAKQQIMAIGGEFGLTAIQTTTLILLDGKKPQPMNFFCRLYHCDASNITGIIDGLEKKGLVSRQNSPDDRRIKVIKLESAGKRLQQSIFKRFDDASGFLFDPLDGKKEKQQLIKIVEKLGAAKTAHQNQD